jgi:uncharacterized protein
MKHFIPVALLLMRVVFTVQPTRAAETSRAYDLILGLKIPMRDGVELNGTVYRSHSQPAPLPLIFTLTPYITDRYHEHAAYFATNGNVFVLVDTRGRGSSEGAFMPDLQEAKDGHDVVEFLARQSWPDGQDAMWGGSYWAQTNGPRRRCAPERVGTAGCEMRTVFFMMIGFKA